YATKVLIATGKLETEAGFHRPGVIEPFQDFDGLIIDAAVHVCLREVIVEFAHSFLQRLRLVLIRFRDVAKSDKLLKSSLGVGGRDLLVERVHAVVAFYLIPARDALDSG